MQYDDGIKEENVDGVKRITFVAGKPLDPNRVYRVATKIKDLTNGQSPPLTKYFKEHPELLPPYGSYINIQTELMGFFTRNLFRKLWEATGERIPDPEEKLEEMSHPVPALEEVESRLRISVLDRDGDGIVTVDDIHFGLGEFLGLSVSEEEKTLAEYIHTYADVTGDGNVTVDDFEYFCTGLPRETTPLRKWSDAFPDVLPEEETNTVPEMPLKHVETAATELTDQDSTF